ncbi:MAG: REP-associated tyrosine transposase [Alcanivorax sediminis]
MNLRNGRVSEVGRIYMITSVTHNRLPHFATTQAARTLIGELIQAQASGLADTLAYVVMPDHFHWLMQLGSKESLSAVVQRIKSRSTRSLRAAGHSAGWQRGFHDHAVREEEDLVQLARYIVANPLRAGLAKSVRDYPHWDAIWLP